jgi:ABC-2 type transport system permease protein
MTSLTAHHLVPPVPPTPPVPLTPPVPRRVALARTIRSEFTKIRSVRSTYWTLTLLVLTGVVWCVAYCLGTVHQWPHMSAQDRAGFDPTQNSVIGLALLGQLVIVVLGALMITSEYSTGTVRASLTAMPRRGTLYAAKAVVFAAVSLVVSFAASFGTYFLGRALLAGTHVPMSLSQPGVLRSVVITALFVEVCGLFAFGVGALVRNAAAALTLTYGCLALLPELIRAMPESVHNALMRWVPGGDALNVMTATMGGQRPLMFSAWGELAVFAGYAAILLAAGAVLFSRRDA